MRAQVKLNLILLVAAAIVIELFAVVSTPFLESLARADVLQKARIMMEAAASIRTYTSNEIAPLLNAQRDGAAFHPQTVPAYAASKNFAFLASKFADYAYRETALNPINPSNRAGDWEADIINDFRRSPQKMESITERETQNGRVLHLANPIVSSEPCLACHGAIDKAPKPMIARYGTKNGFGWRLNEVVGAQIVSVSMAVALEQSARIRNLFIGVLAGVFLLLIGLFNGLPLLTSTRPRADVRMGDVAGLPAAEPLKAFGYGLFAAGLVVVMVGYVAVYAREGATGLEKALDPLVLVNYVGIAALAPGMLTIWLARYFARARAGTAPWPAAHPKETSLSNNKAEA